jgi:hypothetical protein
MPLTDEPVIIVCPCPKARFQFASSKARSGGLVIRELLIQIKYIHVSSNGSLSSNNYIAVISSISVFV